MNKRSNNLNQSYSSVLIGLTQCVSIQMPGACLQSFCVNRRTQKSRVYDGKSGNRQHKIQVPPSADSSRLLIFPVLLSNTPHGTLPDSSKNTPFYFPSSFCLSLLNTVQNWVCSRPGMFDRWDLQRSWLFWSSFGDHFSYRALSITSRAPSGWHMHN